MKPTPAQEAAFAPGEMTASPEGAPAPLRPFRLRTLAWATAAMAGTLLLAAPALGDGFKSCIFGDFRVYPLFVLESNVGAPDVYNTGSSTSSPGAEVSLLGAEAIRTWATANPDHNCGDGEGGRVADWLLENYRENEVSREVLISLGAGASIVQNVNTYRDTDLNPFFYPTVRAGWGLVAANYLALTKAAKTLPGDTYIDNAVFLPEIPLTAKEGVSQLQHLVDDTGAPHLLHINPHYHDLLVVPEALEDDEVFEGVDGSFVHDFSIKGNRNEDTEGVGEWVKEAPGDKSEEAWNRMIQVLDGSVRFELRPDAIVPNLKETSKWSILNLFAEGGYVRGLPRSEVLLGRNPPDQVPVFSCWLEVLVEEDDEGGQKWSAGPAEDVVTREGVKAVMMRDELVAGVNARVVGGQRGINLGQSVDSLWDSLVKCMAVMGFEGKGADRDAGVDQLIPENNETELLEMLEKSHPASEDLGIVGDHIYNEGALTEGLFLRHCNSIFGDLMDENSGLANMVAPLCRYRVFADPTGGLLDFDFREWVQEWIAQQGMWVNRTSMSGIVWITRQVYSFGLVDQAVGRMGAIFAPLREWLTSPVEKPPDPTPVQIAPGGGTVGGGGGGPGAQVRRQAAAEGIPRWMFWGIGVFLGLFVAFQVARGRTAVALKEVAISMVSGMILFWMVAAELRDPGGWYETVGTAATDMVRGVTELAFGGNEEVNVGERIFFEPPANYHPGRDYADRILLWWGGCGDLPNPSAAVAAAGDDELRDLCGDNPRWPTAAEISADRGGRADRRGVDPGGQRNNWIAQSSDPAKWSRTAAAAAMEGWGVPAPEGGWETPWPGAEENWIPAGWPTARAFWEARAGAARWERAEDEGANLLGLGNRKRITEPHGDVISNEMGLVLGTEALNNLYYRTQWGDSLEGPEWRYCRERAWAALLWGKDGKDTREYMRGNFEHSAAWPPENPRAYTKTGYKGGGAKTDPVEEDASCAEEGSENEATPVALHDFSREMPAERMMGPWISAIPTVTLFVAVLMSAIPVLVAQILLAVLFALLPVILFVAVMPGALRKGMYKWVGHLLRAVLTILFGVLFVVLSIWILKAVYLLPGEGIWTDLFIGIAGAVAVWKLRSGLWTGASKVAVTAASGLGKALGSKSEVSLKGDKLGERFLRNAATAANKKRRDALARYEVSKGRVKGAGKMAGMAGMSVGSKLSPYQRARHKRLKDAHHDSRDYADATTAFRNAIRGMDPKEYEKHRAEGFSQLRGDDRYKALFDDKGKMKNDNYAKMMTHHAAIDYSRHAEKKAKAKQMKMRRERYAGRMGFRRANFRDMVAVYKKEVEDSRSKHRSRLRAGDVGDHMTFDLAERGPSGGKTPKWESWGPPGGAPPRGGDSAAEKGEEAKSGTPPPSGAKEEPVVEAKPYVYAPSGSWEKEVPRAKRVADKDKSE